jgi:hypothetical protein
MSIYETPGDAITTPLLDNEPLEDSQKRKPKLKLTPLDAAIIGGALLFTVVANIFVKKVYNLWGNEYVFFRSQLTNLLYNLYASIIVIYKYFFRRSDLKPLAWWKFCVLGLCDGFADILRSVGGLMIKNVLIFGVSIIIAPFYFLIYRCQHFWICTNAS